MNDTAALAPPGAASDLVAGAAPGAEWDEMVTGRGRIRRQWEGLVAGLSGLPEGALLERTARAAQQFKDDGVTHDSFGAPRDPSQAWRFDPLPLVIDAEEWSRLEAGLVERAMVIDTLLADIYGPQQLLLDRIVPAPFVFANPAFLRPCRQRDGGDGRRMLSFYAADLLRGPDGAWHVFADRTEGPAGAGYALEDRQVLGRTMPELFRGTHVRTIQPFFDLWQASLLEATPTPGENPRVVQLATGAGSSTYFEQLHISRRLGIPLVEGSDLTARGGRIYLKTMGGLQRIDVIYRRIDGALCDPLELRGDSRVGVAGLVDAVRWGSTAVVNALGSGVAESPALSAILPAVARRVLGRDLALGSRPAWWCGDRAAREHVRAELERMIVMPTFGGDAVAGASLDEAGRADLLRRIEAAPHRWSAHLDMAPSVAPAWLGTGLGPRPVVLRVFLVAHRGGYVAMPGGVARIPQPGQPLTTALRHGGVSKDVWVVAADRADAMVPAAQAGRDLLIVRSAGELQSRAAETLFWLGRYIERLESAARLLRSALWRLVGGGFPPRVLAELAALSRLLHIAGVVPQTATAASPDSDFLRQALIASAGPDGMFSNLMHAIHGLFDQGRDRFSVDMWNMATHLMTEARTGLEKANGDVDRLIGALDGLILATAAFAGMAADSMVRGTGWRALEIGRRVERGIATALAMHALFSPAGAPPDVTLRLALEVGDSSITYRTRYLSALRPAPVFDLLVADDSNPRAVAFQLRALEDSLALLPEAPTADLARDALAIPARLRETVAAFDLQPMQRYQRDETMEAFLDLLSRVATDLMSLSDAVSQVWFAHVAPPQAVGIDRRAA